MWRTLFDWHTNAAGAPPVPALDERASEQGRALFTRLASTPNSIRLVRELAAWTKTLPLSAMRATEGGRFLGLSLLSGGSTIQISGAGFTSALASSVTIGGVAATNVQIIDAITISARVPAHAAGSVNVVVTVGGKSVTARGGLLYVSSIPRRRATN